MNWYKKFLGGIIILFVVIQFVPVQRNQDNEIDSNDIILYYNLEQTTADVLRTSCYDCHSNNTNYPWYNKIQPVSWLLEKHISEGKNELNFSVFGSYSKRKQKSKLKSIISQIKDDNMPIFSYTIIHREAILDDSKKAKILSLFDDILLKQ